MSLIPTLILLAAQAAAPAAPVAPSLDPAVIPTLKLREIERCNPKSITDATNCISSSMDEDELDTLDKSVGRKYRPAYEALISRTWRLDDPTTPLALDMKKRDVYTPRVAPGVLIFVTLQKLRAERVDYARIAKQIEDEVKRAPAAAGPVAAAPKPAIVPGPRPLTECKQASDAADVTVTACTQNVDGTLTRTVSRPGAAAATTTAPGALPQGIPAGSVQVSLDQCKSSTPLPEGVVLKACWKLPDGRFARQAVAAK